jgi:hypothetical protein
LIALAGVLKVNRRMQDLRIGNQYQCVLLN